MKKPVIVGAQAFPSKKDAMEFFRGIRDRYPDGVQISDEDSRYLSDLVSIHSEAKTKIGCGISHFTVTTDNRFGTRHFMIYRPDGSYTDVSFLSAINDRNHRRDRLEALRHAIACQILNFKSQCFRTRPVHTCPLRHVPVTENSYHVDHTPPSTFLKLVNDWLTEQKIKIDEIQIPPPADNQIVTEMTNVIQRDSWQAYHAENANLRLVSPLGNLSDAKIINRRNVTTESICIHGRLANKLSMN